MDENKTTSPNSGEPPSGRPASGSFGSYLDRRGFLRTSVAAGAGAGLSLTSKSATAQEANKVLKVALVGCGAQGKALMDSARTDTTMDGTYEMTAVCDVWGSNRTRMERTLKAYKHPARPYVDITEMLEKEKDLDAVMIASPDWMHAPHTIEALEAGKAVYCEKMMSNTIEAARTMVKAQERTGGVLQIGHQRRSNPRYLHLRNNCVLGDQIFGRLTHAYAQWNRAVSKPYSWPDGSEIDDATLTKYGYDSMEEFRNWRWYKKYGGGPISDLGAHQIDLFNWIFDARPTSVMASGGIDYYTKENGLFDIEHEDNVMAIYEYEKPGEMTRRAYYQVLTTTSSQGFYEKFMGEYGTASISENPSINQAYREGAAPSWDAYAAKGLIVKDPATVVNHHKFWQQPKTWPGPHLPSKWLGTKQITDVRESKGLDPWELPITLDVRPHAPHIKVFFEAARANDPAVVNCTVQDAFATCVTVLTAINSVRTGEKVKFKPDDFLA